MADPPPSSSAGGITFTRSRTTRKNPASSSSSRRGRRTRPRPGGAPDRFHGAFTGGFSAGHFNTAGTAEGWTPAGGSEDEDEGDGDGGTAKERDEFGRSTSRHPCKDENWKDNGAADAGFTLDYDPDLAVRADGGGPSSVLPGAPQPASGTSRRQKREPAWKAERRPEDYMDSGDEEEWGGPGGVSAEFGGGGGDNAAAAGNTRCDAMRKADPSLMVPLDFLDAEQGTKDPVGRRLLRALGWRGEETGSAYVPADDDVVAGTATATHSDPCQADAVLSKRRLRKITLSQTVAKLPPPKLDTYGLEYDPYRNAPEFAAHREGRRRRAEERAKAASAASGEGRNVYRTNDLMDDDEEEEDGDADGDAGRRRGGGDKGAAGAEGQVLAYETAEDFVGTRSSGGFALHDDDDDVYDTTGGKKEGAMKIGGEEYHTELQDYGSDDDHHNNRHDNNHFSGGKEAVGGAAASAEPNVFAASLSAWASASDPVKPSGGAADPNESHERPAVRSRTSDGRPPLSGFVLGGGISIQDATTKRYPGPDLPRPGYQPPRHEFPVSITAEGMAEAAVRERREVATQRRAHHVREKVNREKVKARDLEKERKEAGPMAGNAFVGLKVAMMDRFATESKGEEKSGTVQPYGLSRGDEKVPDGATAAPAAPVAKKEKKKKKVITVERAVLPWTPTSLLCKRFGVRPPAPPSRTLPGVVVAGPSIEPASGSTQRKGREKGGKEAGYFRSEILDPARERRAAAPSAADIKGIGESSSSGAKARITTAAANTNAASTSAATKAEGEGRSKKSTGGDENDAAMDKRPARPPADLFKSIFEETSEESSSESEQSGDDDDSGNDRDGEKGQEEMGNTGCAAATPGDSQITPATSAIADREGKRAVEVAGSGIEGLAARAEGGDRAGAAPPTAVRGAGDIAEDKKASMTREDESKEERRRRRSKKSRKKDTSRRRGGDRKERRKDRRRGGDRRESKRRRRSRSASSASSSSSSSHSSASDSDRGAGSRSQRRRRKEDQRNHRRKTGSSSRRKERRREKDTRRRKERRSSPIAGDEASSSLLLEQKKEGDISGSDDDGLGGHVDGKEDRGRRLGRWREKRAGAGATTPEDERHSTNH